MLEFTKKIVASDSDMNTLREAIYAFYEVYSRHSGVYAQDLINEKLKPARVGLVVSPSHAAHCAIDIMRTTQFIRGVNAAIEDALKRKKGLRILYAGCGPYATLVTPLTYLYSANQIDITLLDIELTSLKAVKGLYESLNKADYVSEYLQKDATDPEITFSNHFDIIISETMQMALQNECQVPLTRNLVRFLKKGGRFVPERIRLEVYLARKQDTHELEKTDYEHMGRAYDLDYRNLPIPGNTTYVNVPTAPYEFVELHTEIDLFKNIKLGLLQCSLTIPKKLDRYPPGEKRPKEIKFIYQEEPKPELLMENVW